MSRKNGPLFRMLLVLAIGAGLAALAVGPVKPKIIGQIDRASPIVMAVAMDSQPPEHCLLPPKEDKEQASAVGQSGDQAKAPPKKKIIACG
jgi:hypothetical protein